MKTQKFPFTVYPNTCAYARGWAEDEPMYTDIMHSTKEHVLRSIVKNVYGDVLDTDSTEEDAREYLDDVDLAGGDPVVVSVTDEEGNDIYHTWFDLDVEDEYDD